MRYWTRSIVSCISQWSHACVGSLTYTCIEGLIVHAYVDVFFNNPSLELMHFENRRKLSMGNIRSGFFERFLQMIGKLTRCCPTCPKLRGCSFLDMMLALAQIITTQILEVSIFEWNVLISFWTDYACNRFMAVSKSSMMAIRNFKLN